MYTESSSPPVAEDNFDASCGLHVPHSYFHQGGTSMFDVPRSSFVVTCFGGQSLGRLARGKFPACCIR